VREGIGFSPPRPGDAMYNVFISYGRDVDLELAGEVQRGMQTLAKPWYRTRAMLVFRDDTSLTPSSEIWARSIQPRLDSSEYMVLLASEQAARSTWVNREVERWLETKGLDNLVVAKTDGTLGWEDDAGRFHRELATSLPPALADAMEHAVADRNRTPPFFVDLTWARDAPRPLAANPQYAGALAKLVAAVRPGLNPDDVASEEVRVRRQTRRLARLAVSGLAALAIATSAAAVVAFVERGTAISEAHAAESQLLAGQATNTEDVGFASLLAVEAYRLSPTVDARDAIMQVAGNHEVGQPITMQSPFGHSIAFSHDGRLLATTGDGGAVDIWDVKSHRRAGVISTGAVPGVEGVAFSPTADTVATTEPTGIQLWSAPSGRPIGQPVSTQDDDNGVVFSPDGSTLAGAQLGKQVDLWDLSTDPPIDNSVTIPSGSAAAIAMSRRGVLAVASSDGSTTLWDLASGTQLATLPGPRGTGATSVAFDRAGTTLAVGGDDGKIRLWNVDRDTEVGTLSGDTEGIETVAFSPTNDILASGSDDQTIRLWNGVTRTEIGDPLTGHNGAVDAVAFSPDGRTLASFGGDETVRFWSVAPPGGQATATLTGQTGSVTRVLFSPNGQTLASAGASGTVGLWNAQTGRPIVPPVKTHADRVNGIAFSADSKTLASADSDATVRLWNPATGAQMGSPFQFGKLVQSSDQLPGLSALEGGDSPLTVLFSPGRSTIIANALDGALHEYDIGTREETDVPIDSQSPTGSDAVEPSEPTFTQPTIPGVTLPDITTPDIPGVPTGGVVTQPNNSTVASTTTNTDATPPVAYASAPSIADMALSPDGKTLATYDGDTVTLFRLPAYTQIGNGYSQNAQINGIAFNPNGKILAIAGADHNITLEDVNTQRQIGGLLTGHTDEVTGVAFSHDGTTLASSSDDDTVRLWDVASRRQMGAPLVGASGGFKSVAFSPDGRTLVAGTGAGDILEWRIYPFGHYLKRVCGYIDPAQAQSLWESDEPGIGYQKPC
jgi:WD40 repeat protein